ncbi:MAG: polyketide cyclase [Ilumatobacteraceae bacterium]|nr:polyketide cyclase [Ilumatobacteraceae bacterium]
MIADDLSRDDRQDIADLLVRYATGIDRREWTLFRTCFTEDCEADYGSIGVWRDAAAICEWMERVHAACGHTMHMISNQVVSVNDGVVTARSYVDSIVMGPDNLRGVRATGYYDDDLVHGADGWRIARRRFTMVTIQHDIQGSPDR